MRALFALVLMTISMTANAKTKLQTIFKNPKPIIGVVNLSTLPGQEGFTTMSDAIGHAMNEMRILENEGVDAVLFENPNGGFSASPEIIAAMTMIVGEAVKNSNGIVVGVEVLWHDPKASLAIAKATGAKFIRTDFFVDKMMAGGQLVDQDPKEITDYRTLLGCEDVAIFTDVQVKYAEMIDQNKTIQQSTQEAEAAGSDGVVVTGRKSGIAPDAKRVKEVQDATKNIEVVLGSGTNAQNVGELLAVADAAIVGTSISTKTGGVLVPAKVREYMDAVRKLRASLAKP